MLYEKSRVLNSASVGSAKMAECTLSDHGGVSNLLRWTKQKAFIDIFISSGILAAAQHQFPPRRPQDLFVPLTSSALSDRRGQGPNKTPTFSKSLFTVSIVMLITSKVRSYAWRSSRQTKAQYLPLHFLFSLLMKNDIQPDVPSKLRIHL